MMTIMPELPWGGPEAFHEQLMDALDEAFTALRDTEQAFDRRWRAGEPYAKRGTSIRQTPMLGTGGGDGREKGGFHLLAERYLDTALSGTISRHDREWRRQLEWVRLFDRYHDFMLCTTGKWEAGLKRLIMIAECERNPDELLGEFSELLRTRSPLKYLFIEFDEHTMVPTLQEYCSKYQHDLTDWRGTTFHVIQIPKEPSPPSTWNRLVAHVKETGDPIAFVR